MKLKNNYFFTMKENVKDEESVSANLLMRAGMMKKAGSGIYYFLPFGLRTIKKIENIVREEMNNIGSNELIMPSLLPEEIYVASGRRDVFGDDMFKLKDRANRNYVLGPTHEELFLEVARDVIKSHKDMPVSLYQIANKYRDEPRSRYGLIRTREFIMKDAYTFDKDEENLDKSYKLMFDAYKKIFDRIGINYKIVTAPSGVMGGMLSEEFQAISDIGEDTIVYCDECGYSSNLEVCECNTEKIDLTDEKKERELLLTPNCCTIKDLEEQFGFGASETVKTMIYKSNGKFYAALVRGDRDVNEYKLANVLGVEHIEMASFEEDEMITKAKVGFAGPIGLEVPIIVDNEVLNMKNFLVGANKTDYHYKNVNIEDFKQDMIGDIRCATIDDICPKCGKKLCFEKSIEIGNTFKLGTKYSESLNLMFADENNKLQPAYMGSYGIGIVRILAAYVEQNHDDWGMILSKEIAPFEAVIIVANVKDEEQLTIANKLYDDVKAKGIDVLLDDRDVRAGGKFKDMDLIGIPNRITVGKKAVEGIVEFKKRTDDSFIEISINDVISNL